MKLLRFVNSIYIGFQTGRHFYFADDNNTQLLQYRPFGVQKIVILIATGRESWQLYQLVNKFYADYVRKRA